MKPAWELLWYKEHMLLKVASVGADSEVLLGHELMNSRLKSSLNY
jgi:hypothetical protein